MTTPSAGIVSLSGLQQVRSDTATANKLAIGTTLSSAYPLNVKGDASIEGSLTVSQNFHVHGTTTTINNSIIESSNIVVNNSGTGPGISVTQTGAQDIANFSDEAGSIFKIADSGLITMTGTGINKLSITGNTISTGSITANSFSGDGSALTNLPIASQWTTGTGSINFSGGSVGIGSSAPASALDIVGSNISLTGATSASLALNCAGAYNKNLWVGSMGTDHCDASNGQIRMSKTTGSIYIDTANIVPAVGDNNSIYLNYNNEMAIGSTSVTSSVYSYGNWHHARGDVFIDKGPSFGNGNLIVSGSVGIGKTNPACSLDVSGGVNVTGTITAGNVGMQYWQVAGTTGAVNTQVHVTLPTGCIYGNIIGAFGCFDDGSCWFPFNNTLFQYEAATHNASIFVHSTLGVIIAIPTGSTNAASKPFKVIIITTS